MTCFTGRTTPGVCITTEAAARFSTSLTGSVCQQWRSTRYSTRYSASSHLISRNTFIGIGFGRQKCYEWLCQTSSTARVTCRERISVEHNNYSPMFNRSLSIFFSDGVNCSHNTSFNIYYYHYCKTILQTVEAGMVTSLFHIIACGRIFFQSLICLLNIFGRRSLESRFENDTPLAFFIFHINFAHFYFSLHSFSSFVFVGEQTGRTGGAGR